jgi:hypothetical protein
MVISMLRAIYSLYGRGEGIWISNYLNPIQVLANTECLSYNLSKSLTLAIPPQATVIIFGLLSTFAPIKNVGIG